MKINFIAFSKKQTVEELLLRQIAASYVHLRNETIQSELKNPEIEKLYKDILRGRANFKLVVWTLNKEMLEKELDYPKTDYKNI